MKKSVFLVTVLIGFSLGYSQTPPQNQQPAGLLDSSQIYVQEIINSKIPVLIDFWAVWCGPCKLIAPVIEQIKQDYKGKIKVLKINVDRNRDLAAYFRVAGIPSIYILKNKVVLENIRGVQPKQVYIEAINEVLKPPESQSDGGSVSDSIK